MIGLHTTAHMPADDRGNWRKQAACRHEDPEMFFPLQGIRGSDADRRYAAAVEEAKAVCRGCPVVDACLAWALDVRDPHAIAGATTPPERAALLADRDPAPQEPTPPAPATAVRGGWGPSLVVRCHCGRTVPTASNGQLYCSRQCGRRARDARRREQTRRNREQIRNQQEEGASC